MKKNSALKNSQFSILPPSSRLRRAGNSQLRSESGQALLEVLIALTTAVIIISAMTVIVITSLNNAQFSKHQNEATQYAQQGIEILKNQSQSDWSTFSSKNDINYCLSQSNDLTTRTGTGTSCGLNLGIFSREVTIYQSLDDLNNNCDPKPDSALITVSVGWADNKCTDSSDQYCHKVKIKSCIYKDITSSGL